MIRTATPEDFEALIALAVAAGLFPADEVGALGEVLAGHFAGKGDPADAWVIDEEAGEALGVAFYTPAPMTDGTWYVKMIAVRPGRQGQGRGAALMRHAEGAFAGGRPSGPAGRDVGVAGVRGDAGLLREMRLR